MGAASRSSIAADAAATAFTAARAWGRRGAHICPLRRGAQTAKQRGARGPRPQDSRAAGPRGAGPGASEGATL